MIIKFLSLLSLCILTSVVQAQLNDSTSAQLKLRGATQSVEVKVVSFDLLEGNKRATTKYLGKANYEFSKEGSIINKFDNIPLHYKPNRDCQIDTSIYNLDTSKNNIVVAFKKLPETTGEYEIRYYEYDENNLLLRDSIRYGDFLETGFTEGPVITRFLYDQHGNVIYIWFKSSFVFSIWDHWRFEYTYDTHGNWIKMTKYVINQSPARQISAKNLEGVDCTEQWTAERVIKYY